MNEEILRIEKEDPTVLEVFIAEYYFLKKDMKKAYELFARLYENQSLSPVMKESVRNYLVVASKMLRSSEIENMNFSISFVCEQPGLKREYVITNSNFGEEPTAVGMLLEIIDYYLKKKKIGGIDASYFH